MAVYRVGLNKAPFEKLRLADFSIMGQWSCLEFRFLCVLGSFADHPRRFARGGLDKVTPALQVVIVSHLLGEHKRDGNRMNSSKRFTVRYIGLCPC